MTDPLKVLFAAAEAAPFIKVGGLGDVAGSLPAALHALDSGLDLRLALPFHKDIHIPGAPPKKIANLSLPYGQEIIPVSIYQTSHQGVCVYLIENALIREAKSVYSVDNYQDGLKFTSFCLAALAFVKMLDWRPDILHMHDWHAAPAAVALNQQDDEFFEGIASMLTVHNLPYLGQGTREALAVFGLRPQAHKALPEWANRLPLPAALALADKITTVSPGYAAEILTKEFASGLEDFLRSRKGDIQGILNGLDIQSFDPRTDPLITAKFDAETIDARKDNKQYLVSEFELVPDPDIPLITIISRMDDQKGIDIAMDGLRKVLGRPWQAVILGSGSPEIEAQVRELQADHPDRIRAVMRYDAELARHLYAGADMILIPSRYEPCGLTQMIAMRYGCVPLARAVGGLKDTILDPSQGEEFTGFLFEQAAPEAFAAAVERALDVFAGPPVWQQIQRRGMNQDFSWQASAREYLALYKQMMYDKRTIGKVVVDDEI